MILPHFWYFPINWIWVFWFITNSFRCRTGLKVFLRFFDERLSNCGVNRRTGSWFDFAPRQTMFRRLVYLIIWQLELLSCRLWKQLLLPFKCDIHSLWLIGFAGISDHFWRLSLVSQLQLGPLRCRHSLIKIRVLVDAEVALEGQKALAGL